MRKLVPHQHGVQLKSALTKLTLERLKGAVNQTLMLRHRPRRVLFAAQVAGHLIRWQVGMYRPDMVLELTFDDKAPVAVVALKVLFGVALLLVVPERDRVGADFITEPARK